MASVGPTECPGVIGKTVRSLKIFHVAPNAPEIQIDFTDGTTFVCLISSRTELDATLSIGGVGEPDIIERYTAG